MQTARTILMFIGLKIVEITGIVFIPYYIGYYILCAIGSDSSTVGLALNWGIGFIVFGVVMFCFVPVIVGLIKLNWQWAKKLTR